MKKNSKILTIIVCLPILCLALYKLPDYFQKRRTAHIINELNNIAKSIIIYEKQKNSFPKKLINLSEINAYKDDWDKIFFYEFSDESNIFFVGSMGLNKIKETKISDYNNNHINNDDIVLWYLIDKKENIIKYQDSYPIRLEQEGEFGS